MAGPWCSPEPGRGGAMAGRAAGAAAGRGRGRSAAELKGAWFGGRGQAVGRGGERRGGRGGAQVALSAETEMWICKPTASNQGKGIFLLRSQEEVAALQIKTQSVEGDPRYRQFRAPQARVVQRCWVGTPRGASVWVGLTSGPTGACEGSRGSQGLQLGPCVACRVEVSRPIGVAEELGPLDSDSWPWDWAREGLASLSPAWALPLCPAGSSPLAGLPIASLSPTWCPGSSRLKACGQS